MSRASARRRKKALQRAQQQGSMSSFNASMQALVAQQKAMMQQGGKGGVLFSPGIPLQPQPGVTPDGVPRQYSFPIAYNTSVVDRTQGRSDIPPFEQLRYLAEMYSGITLPERVWLDMIPGLMLKIGLTAEMKAQGYDDKDFQKDIATYLEFFEHPDGVNDTHSWLRMAVRDQTQVDGLCVYKHPTRGGQLGALEIVDPATIKPLLDDWGRVPQPPLPAYKQFLWGGQPGDGYTIEQMIYYRETPRSNSPFGFSRVERFIMEVNQALRKKKRDLAMFTEGNIPAGLIEVPEASNWTPDDIAKYEKLWNSLISGNEQQQVRVKFTQPGMKYIKLDNGEVLTDFDYFLYKISCGVYGISLADIGFVEDIHKSSDKGQQNMMYRRTMQPLVIMYAKLFFTDTIHNDFKDPRFEATFVGYEEEEDLSQMATAYKEFASFGAIAPSDVAHRMGFPDAPKTGPFIIGQGGQPIFLKNYEEGSPLRKAQQDAQMAGMQLAANPEQGQGDEEDTDEEGTQKAKASSGQKGKASQSTNDEEADEGEGKKQAQVRQETDNRSGKNRATERSQDQQPVVHDTEDEEALIKAEYRRYRQCAIDDVKRGRPVRDFASNVIPPQEMRVLAQELQRVTTSDEVRAAFKAAQEGTLQRVEESVGDGLDWSDADLDELSRITDDDLKAAVQFWDDNAPDEFKGMLNAEEEQE